MDWYSILFIGIVIHLFYIEEYGEHRSVSDYISYNSMIGLNKGTFALTLRFFSGPALVACVWFVLNIGILSGFLLGIAVFVTFSFFLKTFYNSQYSGKGWHSWIQDNMTPPRAKALTLFNFLISVAVFLLEWSIASWVLLDLFNLPALSMLLLLPGFIYVFSGLGGIDGIFNTGRLLLYGILFSLLLISVYFYMMNGAASIYSKINLLKVDLFPASLLEIVPVSFALVIVVMTGLLLDLYTWQTAGQIKRAYRKSVSWMAPTAVMALPAGVLLVSYYLLYTNRLFSFPMDSSMMTYMIIVCICSLLSLGLSLTLFQVTQLSVSLFFRKRKPVRSIYLLSLVFCFLTAWGGIVAESTILWPMIWITFYGFCASFLPLLKLLLHSGPGDSTPWIIGIGWAFGVLLYFAPVGNGSAAFLVVLVSILLLFIAQIFQKKVKIEQM